MPGDHSWLDTPVPFSNTEVKRSAPMILGHSEKVGRCRAFLESHARGTRRGLFFSFEDDSAGSKPGQIKTWPDQPTRIVSPLARIGRDCCEVSTRLVHEPLLRLGLSAHDIVGERRSFLSGSLDPHRRSLVFLSGPAPTSRRLATVLMNKTGSCPDSGGRERSRRRAFRPAKRTDDFNFEG